MSERESVFFRDVETTAERGVEGGRARARASARAAAAFVFLLRGALPVLCPHLPFLLRPHNTTTTNQQSPNNQQKPTNNTNQK